MSDDTMETRVSRAEWRLDTLEGRQDKQDTRVSDLGVRIDAHHRELMAAIAGLRDDNAKREGVEQARKDAEERNFKRLRAISIIVGIIAALAALGVLTWPGAS